MKYAILLYGDETVWDRLDDEGKAAEVAAHDAFEAAVEQAGSVLGGQALDPVATATTLRRDPAGGVVLTDGPYAETAEQLGGFYLVDLEHLDAVVEACRVLPDYYVVEIRPIMDLQAIMGG